MSSPPDPHLPPEAEVAADAPPDPVAALLVDCMERVSAGESGAIEAVCAAHPEHAPELRERIGVLLQMGLFENEGAADNEFPEQLGPFRLRRRLGGGGMGVVYEAEQEPLGRTVALKLIRPEHLYFPRARERFRRETEAVARLQHPSIVAIHTVGEERGVPFFAMEMVHGATLAEVLAFVSRRAPETLRSSDLLAAVMASAEHENSPSVDKSSELFRTNWIDACVHVVARIADAITHAHARGVLHRDIKPSNISVTPDGRVVLLDFGLASASADLRMTHYGTAIGSVLYMAPEQIQGRVDDIDERTDVYALGVTLYELLSLQVPYVGKTSEEVRAAILEGAPQHIRARNRRVSRDLENVCLKAINGEPARRYATMQAFARDLRNVLEHQPVSAHPPGKAVRALRWIQRHPTGTTATALAALLVLGLPSTLAVQQHKHNSALQTSLDLARTARSAADLARSDADTERDRAKLEARDSETVAQFLVEMFAAADPKVALGGTPTAEQLLARGVERIGTELSDQPELRARLLERMAESYAGLALYPQALPLAEQAVELRRRLHGDDDLRTLDALYLHGHLLRLAGATNQGVEQLVEARDGYLCRLGPQSKQAIGAMTELATSLNRLTQLPQAEAVLDEALAAVSSMPGDSRELRRQVLATQAVTHSVLAQYRGSERCAFEALTLDAQLHDPLDVGRVEVLGLYGEALGTRKAFVDAQFVLAEFIELSRRLYGEDSTLHQQHLITYAELLDVVGRTPEAEELYRSTYEQLRERAGIDFPSTARSVIRLGLLLERLGRFEEARQVLDDALAALVSKLGRNNGRTMYILWRTAECCAANGDLAAAPMMREVLWATGPKDTLLYSQVSAALGNLLRTRSEFAEEARARLEEALHRGRGADQVDAGYGLACMALDDNDASQASDLLDDALRVKLTTDGTTWSAVASQVLRASIEFERHPTESGRKLIEGQLDILRDGLGREHVQYRELCERVARAYDAAGATALAAQAGERIESPQKTPDR